jgi:hypothetical protein
MIRIPAPPLAGDLDGAHPVARCCCHVFTPACPVDCLAAVLSTATFHALARGGGAPFDPPATVEQVLELRQASRLGQVAGLGHRRLGEIDAALVMAGFALDGPISPQAVLPATPALPTRRAERPEAGT